MWEFPCSLEDIRCAQQAHRSRTNGFIVHRRLGAADSKLDSPVQRPSLAGGLQGKGGREACISLHALQHRNRAGLEHLLTQHTRMAPACCTGERGRGRTRRRHAHLLHRGARPGGQCLQEVPAALQPVRSHAVPRPAAQGRGWVAAAGQVSPCRCSSQQHDCKASWYVAVTHSAWSLVVGTSHSACNPPCLCATPTGHHGH